MVPQPPPVGAVESWRPLRPDDVAALTDLQAVCRRAEGAPDKVLTLEEQRHELADPLVPLETDTLGGWSTDGRLVAWGCVWCRPRPTFSGRAALFGDVHPEARGAGIGRTLLAWQVARATERLHEETPAGLPRWMQVTALEDDAPRIALARAAGMTPVRWWHTMTRSLDAAIPVPPVPPGLELVAWTDAASDAVLAARNDAWQSHWGHDPMPPEAWAHRFLDDPHFLRPAGRLALHEGEVVGFVLCTEQASDETGDGRTGWIDQLGVRPAWRRRGLGAALLGAALVALREEGFQRVALDVDADSQDGATDLYQRLGFRVRRTEVTYTRDA